MIIMKGKYVKKYNFRKKKESFSCLKSILFKLNKFNKVKVRRKKNKNLIKCQEIIRN